MSRVAPLGAIFEAKRPETGSVPPAPRLSLDAARLYYTYITIRQELARACIIISTLMGLRVCAFDLSLSLSLYTYTRGHDSRDDDDDAAAASGGSAPDRRERARAKNSSRYSGALLCASVWICEGI